MKPRFACCLPILFALIGCAGPAVRSQSPEETTARESKTKLVGDFAVPFGTWPVNVETVGLVTGLPDTGSDPEPSVQRAALIDELQKRGVKYPDRVLNSPTSSMVAVRGFLRPGIQKGDHFDIEVRVPTKSDTTSLWGGWLMEARLKEQAVVQNQIHDGEVLALAEGAVLVDPSASGEQDKIKLTRGRVLGGGVCLKSRPLGLALKPEHQNVLASSQVGNAINRRFHTFEGGIKGVSTAKTDQYIELKVHPRYKDNIDRYIRVVRSLPLHETAAEQSVRLVLLERQLLDPITSSDAALRLEAIGNDGVNSLKKGLASSDTEVQFYSAEALAYLDKAEAVPCLAATARNEPAFRGLAMAALSAMNDFTAFEALRDMLSAPSAETRYGAFRSLWAMNKTDPLVQGERMNDFSYHVLDVAGPPMVHFTRSYRAEVVLFGNQQTFDGPLTAEAGRNIMVKSSGDHEITVSRFAVNQADQKRVVSTKVDAVIRAVVELGGSYPDVVQLLQQAKTKGALASRLEMDAIPRGGRHFDRKTDGSDGEDGDKGTAHLTVNSPKPDLFNMAVGASSEGAEAKKAQASAIKSDTSEDEEKPGKMASFFAKLRGKDPKDSK